MPNARVCYILHDNQLTTLPWVQLKLLRCLQELNIMHNPLRDEAPLSLQKAIRQAEQRHIESAR